MSEENKASIAMQQIDLAKEIVGLVQARVSPEGDVNDIGTRAVLIAFRALAHPSHQTALLGLGY